MLVPHTQEARVNTHAHSDEGNMADTGQRELIFVLQEGARDLVSACPLSASGDLLRGT